MLPSCFLIENILKRPILIALWSMTQKPYVAIGEKCTIIP